MRARLTLMVRVAARVATRSLVTWPTSPRSIRRSICSSTSSIQRAGLAAPAIVTVSDGSKFEGRVVQDDEFTIGIVAKDGWYRSWPRASVKVEVHDPLQAHHELTTKYTNADLHNLFAYLVTFK